MCQEPMVADIHAERAENVTAERRKQDPGPTEEPGQARHERDKMDKNDRRGISPFDAPSAARRHRTRTRTNGRISHSVVVHARPRHRTKYRS